MASHLRVRPRSFRYRRSPAFIPTAPASGPTVTGTVAATLAPLVSAAAGSSVTGTVARTLASLTSTATGSSVTGTVARTLGGIVSAAAGSYGTATAPGAPTAVQPSDAFGYSSTVTLAWTAPGSNGGSAITDYRIRYSSNDGGSWSTWSHSASTTPSASITGLTINTRYLFEVAAVNAVGTGTPAVSEWGCTPIQPSAPKTPPTTTHRTGAGYAISRIDQRSPPPGTTADSTWTGAGVRIYVVDSGCRFSHNEFASQAFATSYSFDGTSANSSDYFHGTQCCSNAVGPTVGVAYDATLVPVRVYNVGTGVRDLVDGFQWIVDNHPAGVPAVVSSSNLQGNPSTDRDGRSGQTEVDACAAVFADLIAMGIAVIQCMGNTFSPTYIVNDPQPGLVLVGGTDSTDSYWSGSTFNANTSIIAPGASVPVADISSDSAYTTDDGTSFATPLVAGVVACWLQANPTLTPRQISDLLLASSTKGALSGGTPNGAPNRLVYSLADIPPTPVGTVAATLAPLVSAASGTATPPTITGTVARTLASLASAAAGSSVTGTVARTLGSLASSAAGTATPPTVTGTVAATLGSLTSSASGTATPPTVTGTVAQTLGSLVSAAAGSTVTGTSAVTLGSLVSAASGTFTPATVTGTVSQTLAALTSTASGSSVTGTATVTLASLTSSAAGTANPPGTAGNVAVTLASLTSTASGTATPPTVTGTSAVTLGALTSSSAGSTVTGTVARTLASLTSTAAGTANPPGVAGSVAVTLGALNSSASGTAGPPPTITGTVSTTLGLLLSAAAGTATPPLVTGTVARTLRPLVSAGIGSTTSGPGHSTITWGTPRGAIAWGANTGNIDWGD